MFDLRRVKASELRPLFAQHHAYKGAGALAAYAFGVFEDERLVAAYAWQPPPPSAAKNVCAACPEGVLALSRMVAVPKDQRRLKHISKPLRAQMRAIDRTRWPVLVTYSDEGLGHTGYVYQCSGWTKTVRNEAVQYERAGVRTSKYQGGVSTRAGLEVVGRAFVQRWEHWACAPELVAGWMAGHGWVREPIPGKVWASGNQAFRFVRRADKIPT